MNDESKPSGERIAQERIAKFLSRAGVASRREAERMIAAGRVAVNGKTLDTPATLVSARDTVEVDGALIGGPERVRLWRYEDLVTRPAEEVRAMTDWLGLAPEAAVGSGLHARSARRWAADPEFSLALDPAVAAVAERLGYAPADLHNPPKPGRPLAGRVADAAARRVRTARGALSRRVVRPLRDRRA